MNNAASLSGSEVLDLGDCFNSAPTLCPPVSLLGIGFDPLTATEALARIEQMVASRRPHYVITANVDFLVQSLSDAELRRVLLDAPMVLCDSTPLLWASRWMGCPLPERVAGSDLAPHLLRLAATRQYRLFLLGASPEANDAAATRVQEQFPGIVVAGHYAPPFRPLNEMNHQEIIQRVQSAAPDLLFVAFGCPKAEKWMAMHYRALNVPVLIGVGATIDFLAGRMKRAPVWMRRTGLEWAFRLCQEPRRLWRRYATDLFRFSAALAAQRWHLPPRALRQDTPPQNTTFSPIAKPPMSRNAETPPNSAWQEFRISGRLDGATVSQRPFNGLTSPGSCLLDLTGVTHVDSAGVGLLLHLRRRLRTSGADLVLVAHESPIHRTLRRLKVHDFFQIARDGEEALRFLTPNSESRARHLTS